tara:strand:- start:2394 stop:3557 length:1164 start_codon:yes stop_codon:yes gene_type:complete
MNKKRVLIPAAGSLLLLTQGVLAAIESNYGSMYLPGSHDNWQPGATPMELVQDNSWMVEMNFAAGSEFKFTPNDNWSVAFGNGDANVVINDAGSYRVYFYDDSNTYKVHKAPFNFLSNYGSIGVPGDQNTWNPASSALELVDDYAWEGEVQLTIGDNFKFAANGGWAVNWGASCTQGGDNNVHNEATGTYRVIFYEQSGCYDLEAKGSSTGFQTSYSSIAVPGTHNQWGFADQMTLIADYTWRITGLSLTNGGFFKFAADNNWNMNWGANCMAAGDDIGVPDGSGSYTLTFDEMSGCYTYSNGTVTVNQPPVANAGNNITVTEGDTYTLNGNGSSDSDGNIISYSWAGDGSTLNGATQTLTAGAPRSITYTLTVTDDDDATDTDTVT